MLEDCRAAAAVGCSLYGLWFIPPTLHCKQGCSVSLGCALVTKKPQSSPSWNSPSLLCPSHLQNVPALRPIPQACLSPSNTESAGLIRRHSELCLGKKKGGGISNQTVKRLPRHGAAELAQVMRQEQGLTVRCPAAGRQRCSQALQGKERFFFFLSCLSLHLQEQRLHPCLNRGWVGQQQ